MQGKEYVGGRGNGYNLEESENRIEEVKWRTA
jgi:hypothetical protein